MSASRRQPATASSDAVWTADGLRIGAVWVAVAGLAALLAKLTNPDFPHLRAAIPFLTWPLMTPWVAHWARRFPLGRRRAGWPTSPPSSPQRRSTASSSGW